MGIVNGFKEFAVIDASTGKRIGVTEINEFNEPLLESKISPNIKHEVSFSMDNVDFNQEEFQQIFGYDLTQPKYQMELSGYKTIRMQNRKHKQKRINKKWLKMYGFKEVLIPFDMKLDDCVIEKDAYENTYYFTGKR